MLFFLGYIFFSVFFFLLLTSHTEFAFEQIFLADVKFQNQTFVYFYLRLGFEDRELPLQSGCTLDSHVRTDPGGAVENMYRFIDASLNVDDMVSIGGCAADSILVFCLLLNHPPQYPLTAEPGQDSRPS